MWIIQQLKCHFSRMHQNPVTSKNVWLIRNNKMVYRSYSGQPDVIQTSWEVSSSESCWWVACVTLGNCWKTNCSCWPIYLHLTSILIVSYNNNVYYSLKYCPVKNCQNYLDTLEYGNNLLSNDRFVYQSRVSTDSFSINWWLRFQLYYSDFYRLLYFLFFPTVLGLVCTSSYVVFSMYPWSV